MQLPSLHEVLSRNLPSAYFPHAATPAASHSQAVTALSHAPAEFALAASILRQAAAGDRRARLDFSPCSARAVEALPEQLVSQHADSFERVVLPPGFLRLPDAARLVRPFGTLEIHGFAGRVLDLTRVPRTITVSLFNCLGHCDVRAPMGMAVTFDARSDVNLRHAYPIRPSAVSLEAPGKRRRRPGQPGVESLVQRRPAPLPLPQRQRTGLSMAELLNAD